MSAYELGVFETLGNDAMPLDALASRIGLSPVACRRLVMVLVALDLVERHGDGFRNTELGRLCSSASGVNLGAIAKVNPFYHMFEHLTGALREYSPRWQQALGTTPQDAFRTLYADRGRSANSPVS